MLFVGWWLVRCIPIISVRMLAETVQIYMQQPLIVVCLLVCIQDDHLLMEQRQLLLGACLPCLWTTPLISLHHIWAVLSPTHVCTPLPTNTQWDILTDTTLVLDWNIQTHNVHYTSWNHCFGWEANVKELIDFSNITVWMYFGSLIGAVVILVYCSCEVPLVSRWALSLPCNKEM